MKNLEEKIKEFMNTDYDSYHYGFGDGSSRGNNFGSDYGAGDDCDGSDDGFGDGDGFGFGSGSGSGFGSGSGDGSGDGSGYGDGSGFGSGCGNSYGYASGYGAQFGFGDGDGDGYGFDDDDNNNNNNISIFNSDIVYQIDNVPTIIKHIKGNIACGFILNEDLTLTKCFIAKDDKYFAHGKTLKDAVDAVRQKKWQDMDTETIINEFCKEFKPHEKYKCATFFEWHNYLTGSCELGRKTFMKNHNIEMDDEFTVDEFINLTINDYGKKIIKQLKEQWYETNIK